MINLKNKKVVVFGLGVSGISALRLLKHLGAEVFAINGGNLASWKKSPGVLDYCLEQNCFHEDDQANQKILADADLLILSPGIPRDHKILNPIHKNQTPIFGEIELGYQVLESFQKLLPIIAITGTNGKTTTTTFMGEVISDQGLVPFVGGNIGVPFCDMAFEVIAENKKYDYILLELSSFQLESTIRFHANIAMILNVYQNHGERYTDIKDYAYAKFNIIKNMVKADTLIVPSDFDIIKTWYESHKLNEKFNLITFDTNQFGQSYDLTNFKLPGAHNRVNLKFVTLVADILNFKKELVQKTINNFLGVHHRIEFVPTKNSFLAYNDAKSTNWDATLTAISAMEEVKRDLYLIIGGKKRGHGDSILPYFEKMKGRVKRFYVVGEMGPEIYAEIKGKCDVILLNGIADVVESVKTEKFNGVLLLSPAFPSFDHYKSYAERGEHFVKLLSN